MPRLQKQLVDVDEEARRRHKRARSLPCILFLTLCVGMLCGYVGRVVYDQALAYDSLYARNAWKPANKQTSRIPRKSKLKNHNRAQTFKKMGIHFDNLHAVKRLTNLHKPQPKQLNINLNKVNAAMKRLGGNKSLKTRTGIPPSNREKAIRNARGPKPGLGMANLNTEAAQKKIDEILQQRMKSQAGEVANQPKTVQKQQAQAETAPQNKQTLVEKVQQKFARDKAARATQQQKQGFPARAYARDKAARATQQQKQGFAAYHNNLKQKLANAHVKQQQKQGLATYNNLKQKLANANLKNGIVKNAQKNIRLPNAARKASKPQQFSAFPQNLDLQKIMDAKEKLTTSINKSIALQKSQESQRIVASKAEENASKARVIVPPVQPGASQGTMRQAASQMQRLARGKGAPRTSANKPPARAAIRANGGKGALRSNTLANKPAAKTAVQSNANLNRARPANAKKGAANEASFSYLQNKLDQMKRQKMMNRLNKNMLQNQVPL